MNLFLSTVEQRAQGVAGSDLRGVAPNRIAQPPTLPDSPPPIGD